MFKTAFLPVAVVFANAVVLTPVLNAQQIRGVVVEDSTFRAIADAKVEMLSAEGAVLATSSSSATGWFQMPQRNTGQFVVRASHPAYTNGYTLTVAVGTAENITVVLRLSGGPIPIDPLIVKATSRGRLSGYDERVRRRAFGNFITRADIDKRGGYSLAHMLRFTPEIRIERVRDGPFTSDGVFMRSFGELCAPSIFLDGFPVPAGGAFDIDALLSLEAVEGIEVYRSALSAPMEFRLPGFGSDGTCGVIAVWSRPMQRAALTFKRVFYALSLVGGSMLFMELIQ